MNIPDIKIEIPKGFLKSLNDFNQDIKTIFSNYYIYPNGMVISKKHNNISMLGKHLCITDYVFLNDYKDYVINLVSDTVYRVIKDNKKDIKWLSIDNGGNIKLCTNDNDISIGYIVQPDSIETAAILDVYNLSNKTYDDIINNLNNIRIQLSEEDVLSLTKNAYKNIVAGEYKCRITRELMPGLKKSNKVDIYFNDNIEDERLFNMYVIVERNKLKSYHQYTCIYI